MRFNKRPFWDPRIRKASYNKYGPGSRKNFGWKYLKFWKTSYWKLIKVYLRKRRLEGIVVLPKSYPIMFRSLTMTPFDRVKIVIIGQDPYYTKGLPDGLAFSVLPNTTSVVNAPTRQTRYRGETRYKVNLPGSLWNIFKEYREDLRFPYPRTGDLSTWARNGILLINAVWSVEEGKPKSHYKIYNKLAWQELTGEIIAQLSQRKERIVFILWGKVAQEYRYLIDESKHPVIISAHPSPRNYSLTAKDGLYFNGSKPFSKACEYLGISTSIWRLP